MILKILGSHGFDCIRPGGAYYVMADFSKLGFSNDLEFARHLVEHIKVAAVPGSSFFDNPLKGGNLIRFCFCKKYETLIEADSRLAHLSR